MNSMRRIGLSAMMATAFLSTAGCAGNQGAAIDPSKGAAPAVAPSLGVAPSEDVSLSEPEAPPAPPAEEGAPSDASAQATAPAPPLAPAPPIAGATPTSRSAPAKPKKTAPGGAVKPAEPKAEALKGDATKEAERLARDDAAARPGLGTEWGETRTSRISTAPFLRADPDHPFAMASLFYNDEQGARAMANAAGFQRTAPQAFPIAGGAVTIGLRSEAGRFLSGFTAGDKRFAVGEAGNRYSIVLQNLTANRFEVIVSVDGLDVLDGQASAFSKRGYLLDPHGELSIDGFRQSTEEVAAFRFGSVRGSYASQKHGDARNVGVIGVALFHERGTTPWTPEEIQRRNRANPFPGQFATPPGVP